MSGVCFKGPAEDKEGKRVSNESSLTDRLSSTKSPAANQTVPKVAVAIRLPICPRDFSQEMKAAMGRCRRGWIDGMWIINRMWRRRARKVSNLFVGLKFRFMISLHSTYCGNPLCNHGQGFRCCCGSDGGGWWRSLAVGHSAP